ncbi:Uncharacterised protein [Vibrio cholerae]|nr:Uncharacterised protein [Vibrio cholerae]CSC01462.1 Uncharacterised protein [Vibrio cholerae]
MWLDTRGEFDEIRFKIRNDFKYLANLYALVLHWRAHFDSQCAKCGQRDFLTIATCMIIVAVEFPHRTDFVFNSGQIIKGDATTDQSL